MPLLRGGLLGDYHVMRPDELPSEDILREPAIRQEVPLWQEPEDGRHPGDVMKNPLKGVGLLSTDEELQAYLQMLRQRLQQGDIQRGPATWDDARRGQLWQTPETQALPRLGFPEEFRYRNPNSNLLNPGGGYSWPGVDMGQN